MAVYAIGDVHGCYDAFRALLAEIKFNPRADTLWLVGDAVNRGEQSLAMLRWLRRNENSVVMTLGNHDLHLLALVAGCGDKNAHPTLRDIFEAADCAELCGWLRRQKLAHYEGGYLMVHAGVLPVWDAVTVLKLAAAAEAVIAGDEWELYAPRMYGNTPAMWSETLCGDDRLRVTINALTRMRICTPAGEMKLNFSGTVDDIPDGYLPWFDVPQRKIRTPIICGHWSALGAVIRDDLIAIDSGYLWGGSLTAINLSNKKLFQVSASIS